MHRRWMLGVFTGAMMTVLAGCTGGPVEDPDDEDPDDDPTPTLQQVRIDSTDCERPESATISFDAANHQVSVRGCVTGRNTCHYPEVASAGYADGKFELRIVTEDQSDEGEMCAQVLTDRGYLAMADFDGGVPSEVEVIHDDVHGRAIVATGSR